MMAALPIEKHGRTVSTDSAPAISVIIPALNEALTIAPTLWSIPDTPDVEVIVVDGGSHDATIRIAETFGARVIRAQGGRACQLNAGAAAARADVLLFLHADTRLPADFVRAAQSTLRRPEVIIGAFPLKIDSPRWSLRLVEVMANFRSRWLGLPYGDQALFLRRHHFRTARGFAEQPLMEDFEFVRRIRRWGRVALAPAAVVTSARRWERLGVARTTLLNQWIILAYLFGIGPSRLARWYRGESSAEEVPSCTASLPQPPPALSRPLDPAARH